MRSVVLSSVLVCYVAAMSTIVPQEACVHMFPAGHDDIEAQTVPPPYLVMVPEVDVPRGSLVNVVIAGADANTKFKGFFVKGFNTGNSEVIGNFLPNKDGAIIKCDDPAGGTGMHHKDPTPKQSVMLEWQAPVNYNGTVQFLATIVMEKHMFWTQVGSNVLKLV